MKASSRHARVCKGVLPFILAACASTDANPTGTAPKIAVRFLADTVPVEAGDTLSLALAAVPGFVTPDRKSITWRSEDVTVASVSVDGLVTGGRVGSTRVTATSGSAADTIAVAVGHPRTSSVRATLVAGGDQITYRANGSLSEPIVARLVHVRSGRPITAAAVEWRASAGTVTEVGTTSSDSGVVSVRWALARTAGTHTLALRLPPDTGTLLDVRGSLGIRTLTVSGLPALAWPGDTLRPTYLARDEAGDPLDPGPVAIQLPATSPLRTLDGRLIAVREGRANIAIEGTGYRDSLSITIGTLLRGQGIGLLAGQRVDDAWFYLRSGACVDSAKLETDGRFVLRATRPLHGQVSDQYFDVPTSETRGVLPSARFGARVDSGVFVQALLFPWDVVIPSGLWSGQRRPVSLFAAMSGGEAPLSYYGQVKTGFTYAWPSTPVPVFFDRESEGVGPITSADSVATWQALGGLEQSIGLDLFQPSEARSHPQTWFRLSDGDSVLVRRGGIAVQLRAHDSGGSIGRCNGVLVATLDCPRVVDYEAGSIVMNAPTLVILGALNALGFRHTCMFPSALSGFVDDRARDLCNQFRIATADEHAETTPVETAHIHLYFALTRMLRQYPNAWSVRETLDGQRVLQYGLPSLGALYSGARAAPVGRQRATVGGASCR